jgi:hypothetical protein
MSNGHGEGCAASEGGMSNGHGEGCAADTGWDEQWVW